MSSLVGRFGCPTRLAYRVDCLLDPYRCQHSTIWWSRAQTPRTTSVGGCRRVRRARAGFEIDHSEPQARVWRSRGRPGPKAPDTQAPHHNLEPRPTSARPPGANTTCNQRGGCRRARRARACFEIDHSEPQARVWRSRGRPGPEAPDTQALLTDTSMSREKRGPVRTGNRVPSGGPRPGWRPPRLCPGRPGVPQPARSRGGRR